jgi:hypothetical protein
VVVVYLDLFHLCSPALVVDYVRSLSLLGLFHHFLGHLVQLFLGHLGHLVQLFLLHLFVDGLTCSSGLYSVCMV